MSRFLTVTNEAHTTWRQWQREGHLNESSSTLLYVLQFITPFYPLTAFCREENTKRKDFQRFRSVLSLITAQSDQSDQWYPLFDMMIMTSFRPELQQWGRSKRWSITVKIAIKHSEMNSIPNQGTTNRHPDACLLRLWKLCQLKKHIICSLLLKTNIVFNLCNYLLQNYNANVLIGPSLEDLAGFKDQLRKKKEKHISLSYPCQHLWKTLCEQMCAIINIEGFEMALMISSTSLSSALGLPC